MKSFLLACVVVIGGAFIASTVLNGSFQTESTTAFTTEGARLSATEQNLINN